MSLHKKITIKGIIAQPRERVFLGKARNSSLDRMLDNIHTTVSLYGWKYALGLFNIQFGQQ